MTKSANRIPVTLRFNHKDITLMKAVVNKEFGPGVRFEHGLRQVLLNTIQAYLNQLAAKAKETQDAGHNAANDDSSQPQVSDTDSTVLADSGNSVDSQS